MRTDSANIANIANTANTVDPIQILVIGGAIALIVATIILTTVVLNKRKR